MSTLQSDLGRLEGVTAFIEDWHAKVAFLGVNTVEPPIKDTPNKEHLSIKDKSTHPISYYTSTF